MQQLNDTLVNLVQDKLDNRIVIERDDEIGEALRNLQTVQTIIRFSRDEVQAVQRRAEAQRKADMTKLADGFEAAIGEIVDTVSSAATELEASASTLSSTAGRAKEIGDGGCNRLGGRVQQRSFGGARPPRRCRLRFARSAGRCRTPPRSRARRSTRRTSPPIESANCRGRLPGSAMWSSSSTRSRARPICSRSMPRSRPRGRVKPVAASRWWRPRSRRSPNRRPRPPGEIGQQIGGIQTATQDSRQRHRRNQRHHRAPVGDCCGDRRGRGSSRARRPRRLPATSSRPPRAPSRSRPNVGDVQRGASETGAASSQVLSAAQMLSPRSNRLKLEVGKFLNSSARREASRPHLMLNRQSCGSLRSPRSRLLASHEAGNDSIIIWFVRSRGEPSSRRSLM